MKKICFAILFLFSFFLITGCKGKEEVLSPNKMEIQESEKNNMESITNIKVEINHQIYNVLLEQNETVESFLKMLPKEFQMSELNGNEKYVYMDESLPTNAYKPKEIQAGDIMLYGSNCLVLFYKSFSTNYSYTKIGHMDNLPDLKDKTVLVEFLK